MINERNLFLKRTTPKSPQNMNNETMPNVNSPLKISSQMVLSNDFSQKNYPKNKKKKIIKKIKKLKKIKIKEKV